MNRFGPGELPDDIYRQLVGDLYGPVQSVIMGILSTALVGSFISWRTGSASLAALTAAMTLVAVGRMMLLRTFRTNDVITRCIAELHRWELIYLASTSLFTVFIGALCFVAIVFTDDAVSQLLIVSLATGYTTGVTRRSSS